MSDDRPVLRTVARPETGSGARSSGGGPSAHRRRLSRREARPFSSGQDPPEGTSRSTTTHPLSVTHSSAGRATQSMPDAHS